MVQNSIAIISIYCIPWKSLSLDSGFLRRTPMICHKKAHAIHTLRVTFLFAASFDINHRARYCSHHSQHVDQGLWWRACTGCRGNTPNFAKSKCTPGDGCSQLHGQSVLWQGLACESPSTSQEEVSKRKAGVFTSNHYDKDERIELKRKLDMMDANEDTRDGEEGSA